MKRKKFLAASTPMYEALFGEPPDVAGSTESGLQVGDLSVEPVENDACGLSSIVRQRRTSGLNRDGSYFDREHR